VLRDKGREHQVRIVTSKPAARTKLVKDIPYGTTFSGDIAGTVGIFYVTQCGHIIWFNPGGPLVLAHIGLYHVKNYEELTLTIEVD
jgi:hypothetical protein